MSEQIIARTRRRGTAPYYKATWNIFPDGGGNVCFEEGPYKGDVLWCEQCDIAQDEEWKLIEAGYKGIL